MPQSQEWTVEAAMRIVMSHKKPGQTKPRRPLDHTNIEINEATLKQCLFYMAHVVDEHGDIYLPIFMRLKEELEKRKAQDALKHYAKQLINREIEL